MRLISCCEPSLPKVAVQLPLPLATAKSRLARMLTRLGRNQDDGDVPVDGSVARDSAPSRGPQTALPWTPRRRQAAPAAPVRSASRGHYLSIDVSSIFASKTLSGEPSHPLWVCAEPKQDPSKMSPPKPTAQTLLASAPRQDRACCLIVVQHASPLTRGRRTESRSPALLRRYCFANLAVLLCAQADR